MKRCGMVWRKWRRRTILLGFVFPCHGSRIWDDLIAGDLGLCTRQSSEVEYPDSRCGHGSELRWLRLQAVHSLPSLLVGEGTLAWQDAGRDQGRSFFFCLGPLLRSSQTICGLWNHSWEPHELAGLRCSVHLLNRVAFSKERHTHTLFRLLTQMTWVEEAIFTRLEICGCWAGEAICWWTDRPVCCYSSSYPHFSK